MFSMATRAALLFALLTPITGLAATPAAPVCGSQSIRFTNSEAVIISDESPAVVTSTISVSGLPPVLWDVDLTTFIRHTFSADLDITLTSPSGTIVTVTSDNGGSNDDIFNGSLWDDQADPGSPISSINPVNVTSRTFTSGEAATPITPEEPLGAFRFENPNGVWTLTVSDDLSGDGGSIDSWSLDITAIPHAPVMLSVHGSNTTPLAITDLTSHTSTIDFPMIPGTICDISLTTAIEHTFAADIDASLTSPKGTIVTLTTDNGSGNDNVFNGTTWSDRANLQGQLPYVSNPGVVTDHPYASLVPATPLSPEEALSAVLGENPGGTWTLTVADDLGADTGTLRSWELHIAVCPPATDSDLDGTLDACDACPLDPDKVAPGACGCGVSEADTDNDGLLNCFDGCPDDPAKLAPGACGCGIPDSDANLNGILDCRTGDELRAKLDKLSGLVKSIKKARTPLQTVLGNQRKKEIRAALTDLAAFASQNGGTFVLSSPDMSLNSLVADVSSKVKKASKGGAKLARNKKRALKALTAFRSAL